MKTKSKIVIALSSVALLCFAFVAYFSFANNTSENLNNTTIPEAQTNNVSNNIKEEFLPTTSQEVYSNNNTYSSNILSEEDEAAYLSSCMDVVVKEGNQKAAEKREAAKNSDNTLCSTAKENDVDLYYLIKYDPEANQNTLHISSEAVHNDDTYIGFDSANEVPWYDNRFDISKVEIDDIIHPLCLKAWFGCINKLDSGQVKLSNIVSFSGLENIQLDDNFNGNASFLFAGCNRIPADITFSSTNLVKVKNAMAMFTWSAFSDENLQTFLSNLTASTDFSYSFCHTGITKAALPQSAIQNATSLEGMFSNDNLLSQVLNLPSTTSATKAVKMFNNCSSLWDIQAADGTNWSILTSLESANMFNGCIQLPNYAKYSERGELDKTHVNFTQIGSDTGGFIVKQGAPKISIEIDNTEHGTPWFSAEWNNNPLTVNESDLRFNYFKNKEGVGQINIYNGEGEYRACSGVDYQGSYINKKYQVKYDDGNWEDIAYDQDIDIYGGAKFISVNIITTNNPKLTLNIDDASLGGIWCNDPLTNPYFFENGQSINLGNGTLNVYDTNGEFIQCMGVWFNEPTKYELDHYEYQIGGGTWTELTTENVTLEDQDVNVVAVTKQKPTPSDYSLTVTAEEGSGITITPAGIDNPYNFVDGYYFRWDKPSEDQIEVWSTPTPQEGGWVGCIQLTNFDTSKYDLGLTVQIGSAEPCELVYDEMIQMSGQNYIVNAYLKEKPAQTHNLTINYLDKEGTEIHDAYSVELGEGDAYSVKSPVIENYALVDPEQDTISGTMGTEDITVDVQYKLTKIVWTAKGLPSEISYRDSFIWQDGNEHEGVNTISCSGDIKLRGQAANPYVSFWGNDVSTATVNKKVSAYDTLTLTFNTYTKKDNYISINGTIVDVKNNKATYTFTEDTENPVIEFNGGSVHGSWNVNKVELEFGEQPTPTPEHTLTINYVDEDGKIVADPYFGKYKEGDDYSVDSPEVSGYTLVDPDQATISGTMGDKDITVDVKYKLESESFTMSAQIDDESRGIIQVTDELKNPQQFNTGDTISFKKDKDSEEGYPQIFVNLEKASGWDIDLGYYQLVLEQGCQFDKFTYNIGGDEIDIEDGQSYTITNNNITITAHTFGEPPTPTFTMSAQIDDESRGNIQVTGYLENPLLFSAGDTVSFIKDKDSEEGYPQIFVAITTASGIQYDLGYYQLVLEQGCQFDKFTYNIGGDEIDIEDGQSYTITNNNITITAHTFGEPPTPTFTMSAQIDDEAKGHIDPFHLDNPCSFDVNDAVGFKASVSEQGSYPQIEVNITKQSGAVVVGSYRLICNPGYELDKFTYKCDEHGQEFEIGDEWINIKEANIMFTAYTKEKAVTRTALFDSYNGETYDYYPVFNANDVSKYRFYDSETSSEALPVNSMSDLASFVGKGNLWVACLTGTPCTAIRGAEQSFMMAFYNGQYIGLLDYFKRKGETCANINWKPESTSSTVVPKINDVPISGENGIYSAYEDSPFAGYNGVWSCVPDAGSGWRNAIYWDIVNGNWDSLSQAGTLAVVFTRDFR